MHYNIFNKTAPAMPQPSRGTEFCKLLLSQATKDMRDSLVPMAMPALASHLTDVEFKYCDNKYYELCGQMANLVFSYTPHARQECLNALVASDQ